MNVILLRLANPETYYYICTFHPLKQPIWDVDVNVF